MTESVGASPRDYSARHQDSPSGSRGGVRGGVGRARSNPVKFSRGLNGLKLWRHSPPAAAENGVLRTTLLDEVRRSQLSVKSPMFCVIYPDENLEAQNRAFAYFEEEFLGTSQLQKFNFIGESADALR